MIKRFLPTYYNGNIDFDALMDSEQPLFDLLYQTFESTLSNQFVFTTDEDGIARFEQMLGLPSNGDLEGRRFAVLLALNSTQIYNQDYISKLVHGIVQGEMNAYLASFEAPNIHGLLIVGAFVSDALITRLLESLYLVLPLNFVPVIENSHTYPDLPAPIYTCAHVTYTKHYHTTAGA